MKAPWDNQEVAIHANREDSLRAIHESIIQRLGAKAAARLGQIHGGTAREGFEAELIPYILTRVPAGSGEEALRRHVDELEDRWDIIGHGMALAAAEGLALESRWTGAGAPFRREAREALCAMVWPDGSMEVNEMHTRATRLVEMLRNRYELGLKEEEFQGTWGEMLSH